MERGEAVGAGEIDECVLLCLALTFDLDDLRVCVCDLSCLFGDDKTDPIVTDSRQIDVFGSVLESDAATDYLERNPRPSLETAARMAGRDEFETSKHIERAADEVEVALGSAHHHKASRRMRAAVDRLARDTLQLLELFPSVRSEVLTDARTS